jgi:hypothetical protein
MGVSPQPPPTPLGWASLVDHAIAVYRTHWRPLLGLAAAWYGVYYVLYGATSVPGLGGLVPLVLLLRWARRLQARTRRLEWSILLMTPFGLLLYWAVRWSLWGPLVVLEGAGPRRALGRSSQLVAGRWFHVALVLGLVHGLVLIGDFLPYLMVPLLAGQADLRRLALDDRLIVHVVRIGLGLFTTATLSPLPPTALTLLLLRLREAREGTDLAARVDQLEATTAAVIA